MEDPGKGAPEPQERLTKGAASRVQAAQMQAVFAWGRAVGGHWGITGDLAVSGFQEGFGKEGLQKDEAEETRAPCQ